jgi:DNA replication protein DnaC
MSTPMLTVTCACGATTQREPAPGRWARFLDSIPYQCPACAEAEKEQFVREEARRAKEQHLRRVTRSELPTALQGLTWEDIERTTGRADALAAARAWANSEITGVALTGPIGAGKTRIAAVAANELLRHRFVVWMTAPLLFARLGSGFGSQQHDGALEVLSGTTALVLDDLDKTRPTAYAAEQVFVAIDQRVENNVPLLVTMNLTLDELAEKYPDPFGEAIASRLTGYCRYRTVDGPDLRVERQPA